MSASSAGYNPDYFKVRAGVPVKWVIKNDGVSGCTDAIISQDLFAGEVPIDQAEVIKEFTPEKPGRYKFSCWMGMVTGTIDVVDETGELSDEQIAVPSSFDDDSGGGGCGCSGGCGGDCGNAGCPYAK
jgi:plastocyanin domain-containing protein